MGCPRSEYEVCPTRVPWSMETGELLIFFYRYGDHLVFSNGYTQDIIIDL